MTDSVRLRLSRRKGFVLQDYSRTVNGLPARSVTRPHLFGNIFTASETLSAAEAVRMFRRFLRRWSDAEIMHYSKDEHGGENPAGGLVLICWRNTVRANVHRLRGHNVACFCPLDAPCHGDVYLDLLATDWPERWKARYPALDGSGFSIGTKNT